MSFPGFLHTVLGALPAEDVSEADHICRQLFSLEAYVKRFGSALDLLDFSEQEIQRSRENRRAAKAVLPSEEDIDKLHAEFLVIQSRLLNWKAIARRDAGMTIWDFCKTIYETRNGLDRCPSLNQLVDRRALERVIKAASDAFPERKDGRDLFAHPADMTTKTARDITKNALPDGGFQGDGLDINQGAKEVFLYDVALGDGSVTFTMNGRIVTVKVTREAHAVLSNLYDQMTDCFLPVYEALIGTSLKDMGFHSGNKFRPDST